MTESKVPLVPLEEFMEQAQAEFLGQVRGSTNEIHRRFGPAEAERFLTALIDDLKARHEKLSIGSS